MRESFLPPFFHKDDPENSLERTQKFVEKNEIKKTQVDFFKADVRTVILLFKECGHDPQQFAHALLAQRLFSFVEMFVFGESSRYISKELEKVGKIGDQLTAAFTAAQRYAGIDEPRLRYVSEYVSKLIALPSDSKEWKDNKDKLLKNFDFLGQAPFWSNDAYSALASLTWQKGIPQDIAERAGTKLAELVQQFDSLEDFVKIIQRASRFSRGGRRALVNTDVQNEIYNQEVEKDGEKILQAVVRAIAAQGSYDDYHSIMSKVADYLELHPSSVLAHESCFLAAGLPFKLGQDSNDKIFRKILIKTPPLTNKECVEHAGKMFFRSDIDPQEVLRNFNTIIAAKAVGDLTVGRLNTLVNFSDWQKNGYSSSIPDKVRHAEFIKYVADCVQNTLELEVWQPGSSETLTRYFNVTNFGRYPLEIWQHMYKHRDDSDMVYGQVVDGKDDNNSAFASSESKKLMLDIFNQLKRQGAGLRIIEIKDARDYLKQLRKIDNRYGNKHKIAFIIARTHGAKNGMQFGEMTPGTIKRWSDYVDNPILKSSLDQIQNDTASDLNEFREFVHIIRRIVTNDKFIPVIPEDISQKGVITQRQLKRAGARVVRNYINNSAPILLISCATGAEGGLAQESSMTFKTTAIAPATTTAIPTRVEIKVNPDETVEFSSVVFPGVTTKTYKNGKHHKN